MKKGIYSAGLACLLWSGLTAQDMPQIQEIGRYRFEANSGGAEIISMDIATKRLFSTRDGGVEIIDASALDNMSSLGRIDLNSAFGPGVTLDSVSSVEIDPLGRGFGVVSLIPRNSNQNLGKLVFFDVNTGSVLKTLDVGYHPDAVTFSKDGTQVFVANEAQFTPGGPQVAGSISYIELGAGFQKSQISGLNNNSVTTVDFSAENLAAGVSIDVLRMPASQAEINQYGKVNLIEPEYVTARDGKAYVTLQENNGIAVFDTQTKKWELIHSLGTIDQRIDPSDRDGGINVSTVVKSLPQPDTVKSYQTNGRTLLVTVDEGDYRVDDGDRVRVKSANLDPAYKSTLNTTDAGLGRLLISRYDGVNENGRIEEIHTFGGRSISIIDPVTGERVFNSGSFFESYIAANDPRTFNFDWEKPVLENEAGMDMRSDNKGPEPEALAIGEIAGRMYAFVGMERQGGLFIFDITDPTLDAEQMFITYYSTLLLEYDPIKGYDVPVAGSDLAPESIIFLSAAESPTGKETILMAFEDSQTIVAYDVSMIPELEHFALLLGIAGILWVRIHRKAKA